MIIIGLHMIAFCGTTYAGMKSYRSIDSIHKDLQDRRALSIKQLNIT